MKKYLSCMKKYLSCLLGISLTLWSASIGAAPADPLSKEELKWVKEAATYIEDADVAAGVSKYVTHKLRYPPYFQEGCKSVDPVPAGFEGVSVLDCSYTELGLKGWVRIAVPSPDLITDWITKAASFCQKPSDCAAKIAAFAWYSNQFSFPLAGNIIEPATSGGGSSEKPANFIFIYGVTVARPARLTQFDDYDFELQKSCSLALLAIADGLTPEPVPGDGSGSCNQLSVAQVSRPANIRQDTYIDYGDPTKVRADRLMEVGSSCPASGRKATWLNVSKSSFISAVSTHDHPLFDAAARAIDAGINHVGKKKCL